MDETRARILSSAMKLFAEKGYSSTSVADISCVFSTIGIDDQS